MDAITQIAAIIRGVLNQISPSLGQTAAGLPDVAIVGAVAGVALLVLIILFSVIGALSGGKKTKRKVREAAAAPRPAARAAAPQPAPPPQRAAAPAPADPVQKIQRDAESGVARVKQDTERLMEILAGERAKAAKAEKPFAAETPTRAFQLLAQALMASDAPAMAAARRRVASGDLDGARADLRRHAQDVGGRDGAWRNLAAIESLFDLDGELRALEQARAVDAGDFVTLVMLRRIYAGINRPQQAHDAGIAAVAAASDDRERAIGLDELGLACLQLKDAVGARKAMTESLELVERLAARLPNDMERQRDIAVGHYKLATLGGPDSRDRLVSSIAAFERLSAQTPLTPDDAQAVSQLKAVLADMDKAQADKK